MTDEVKEMFVSPREMGKMVNKRLLGHLTEAMIAFPEDITITEAEVTVAGFLGMEVGNSCNNLEEIEANVKAYYRLILDLAQFTLKVRMSRN